MFRSVLPVPAAFAALILSAVPAVAEEVDTRDFVAFASSHCRAFVGEGRADLSFAMGKAAAKFTQEEMIDFNQAFAAKIIEEYHIDPAKGCVLDSVTVKPVRDVSSKPADNSRFALPKAKRQLAVVSGELGSRDSVAPVAVSYRLEQIGASPWVITNISLNGQPLVDRYREHYEALAARGGSQAVLDNL